MAHPPHNMLHRRMKLLNFILIFLRIVLANAARPECNATSPLQRPKLITINFDSVGIKPCASINSTSFAGISFFDNSGALAKLHNTTETVDCHNHIDSPARGVFGLSTSQPNAVYAQNGLVLKSNGKQSFGFVGFSFKADVNRYALDEPFAFIRVKGFDVCGQEVAHLTKSFKGKNYGFSDAVAFDVQDSAEPFTDLDKVQIDFWWIWIDGPTVINRPLQNAMVDDIKLIVKRS